MRKLFVLILICSSAFAQNYWQNEITLNYILSQSKTNSCVSSKGVHIVYTHNGGLKYALSSPSGSIIKQDIVIENEGAGCSLPNVVAINNDVYAIYVRSNYLRVSKSSNLGDTWTIDYSHYPLVNTNCTALITLLENEKVHITWNEDRTSYIKDVHYVCFYYSNSPTWNNYKDVTDIEYSGGEMPSIALSQDRVHIGYKTSSLYPKSRDMFRSNNEWQSTSQQITPVMAGTVLSYEGLYTINNQLHAILRQDYVAGETPAYYIKHFVRSTDNVTWQQTASSLNTDGYYSMISAKTQNNKIHLIYFDKNENNWIHRYFENSTWSSPVANNIWFHYTPALNVDGNDLYLTSNYDELTPSAVKMRRYDDAPIIPENFTLTSSQNWHPYLKWNLTQADIQNFYLERSLKSNMPGSQWSAWEILPAIASTQNYYEDLTISNASGVGPLLVRYRLRAKDVNNYSDYTSSLQMAYGTSAEKRIISNDKTIKDYVLMQNYPNPFNPSTIISFQIPEPGLVQLKVYNLLGKEVESLVNEFKPAGEYSININATGLPSGVYIYSLRVNGYVQNQKMTLTK